MNGQFARLFAISFSLLCTPGCREPVEPPPAPAQPPANTVAVPLIESVEPVPFEDRLRAALVQTGDFDFDKTPLQRAILSLEGHLGLPIVIDPRVYEDNDDAMVTLHARGISVGTALEMVLSSLSLDYVIDGDMVRVITTEDARGLLSTRVIDVTDLVTAIGDADDLHELVTTMVYPTTWDEVGGPGALRITRLNGRFAMTLSQTWRGHEAVNDLLRALRKVPMSAVPDAPLVEAPDVPPPAPLAERAVPPQREPESLTFSCNLYRAAAAKEQGNICVSPWNVASALLLLHAGAEGQTRDELTSVLRIPANAAETAALYTSLNEQLSRDSDSVRKLSSAHRLWIDRDFALLPGYVEFLGQHYQAVAVPMDRADPAAACLAINDWVKERTSGKIDAAVAPVDLAGPMYLASVLYFNQLWAAPFPGTDDTIRFQTANGPVEIPSMAHNGEYRYRETTEQAWLEKDYAGGRLTMAIALPHRDGPSLAEVEQSLTAAFVQQCFTSSETKTVVVELPRFQFESDLNLKPVLQELGIRAAFDPELADFSAATEAPHPALANFKHIVTIDVHERGTEAAAFSGTGGFGGPMQTHHFRADHPFVFLICDRPTCTVLFAGRFVGP